MCKALHLTGPCCCAAGAAQRCEDVQIDESKCMSVVWEDGWCDLEADSDGDLLHVFLGLQVALSPCCVVCGCFKPCAEVLKHHTRWRHALE